MQSDLPFQPLFGHGASEPVTYQQIGNGELFCADDPEVDVVKMVAAEPAVAQLAAPTVNGTLFMMVIFELLS